MFNRIFNRNRGATPTNGGVLTLVGVDGKITLVARLRDLLFASRDGQSITYAFKGSDKSVTGMASSEEEAIRGMEAIEKWMETHRNE